MSTEKENKQEEKACPECAKADEKAVSEQAAAGTNASGHKPLIVAVIFIAVVILFGIIVIKAGSVSGKDRVSQVVAEANKELPMMIDGGTRLEAVEVLPENKIRFSMTIMNHSGELPEMSRYKDAMLANVRSNPGLKILRDNEMIMVYRYGDEAGNELSVFEFTPEDYK
jgi:hypothetical protein